MQDNLEQFMQAYRDNIRAISRKTMLSVFNLPQDDLDLSDPIMLDARICWMVTDNLRSLLALTSIDAQVGLSQQTIEQELQANHVLIVYQDRLDYHGKPRGQDHYFVIIGDHGMAHIIEHLENQSNSVYTDTIENMSQLLIDISQGKVPDRFYHERGCHIFQLSSWSRRALSAQSVIDYLA